MVYNAGIINESPLDRLLAGVTRFSSKHEGIPYLQRMGLQLNLTVIPITKVLHPSIVMGYGYGPAPGYSCRLIDNIS